MGVETALVVGGGNILRGASFSASGAHRASADYMGMLGTVINALALSRRDRGARRRDARADGDSRSARWPSPSCAAARSRTSKGPRRDPRGGHGQSLLHDRHRRRAARRRASLRGAAQGTKVDGVYTADPPRTRARSATSELTYMQVLEQRLQVMDGTAITLCMENQPARVVFDLFEEGNIERVVRGEPLGRPIRSSHDSRTSSRHARAREALRTSRTC
jgi:uridylate kinase